MSAANAGTPMSAAMAAPARIVLMLRAQDPCGKFSDCAYSKALGKSLANSLSSDCSKEATAENKFTRMSRALSANNRAHDVDRPPQQGLRSFQRAEAGMGRQRDIVHAGERMVGLERLGMEHVEAGMADAAAAQTLDQRGLIDQGAARGVDQHNARLHARHLRGA